MLDQKIIKKPDSYGKYEWRYNAIFTEQITVDTTTRV